MDIVKIISDELGIKPSQTQSAIALLDEGNTVPFIARYRKEATGALDDGQLRLLEEKLAVEQISNLVGYSSASYFSSAFKQKYNLSPKQYQTQKLK